MIKANFFEKINKKIVHSNSNSESKYSTKFYFVCIQIKEIKDI